jgi:large subunit ribosomal protein L4
MKISVYNLEGKKLEDMEVSEAIFGMKANDELVQQTFVSIQSNQRQVLAHTKNRGERAGSGIKPWKQKGTGRARVGSVRTPTWRKGGVAFGPRNDRNFKKKINKKMNAQAIKLVLSGKAKDNELKIIDKFEFKDNKTKEVAAALSNLKIASRILLAFSAAEKDARIASRNIAKAENIMTAQLNIVDMLNNKYLLMSKESVKYLEEKYAEDKK